MHNDATSHLQGSTLLMIDDSPVNLAVVIKSLEDSGAELLVAVGGEEALQRAEMTKPDLILLDVMMPDIDGFEVCRKLKENPATSHIPVIFMTSLSTVSDKVTGFEAGGVDYLTKPLQLDEVRARINVHLKLKSLQQRLYDKNVRLEQEISERTRLEAELQQRAKFQQGLLDAVCDVGMQLMVVEGGRIIHVANRKLANEFGYTDEMLADHPPFAEIIHPDDRARTLEHYRRKLAGEEVAASYELGLVSRDGQRSEYEFSIAVLQNSDPPRLVTVGKDISLRIRMKEELFKREEAFRAIAENTPDTIARYDRNGHRIYANPALKRLLGGGKREVLNVTPGALQENSLSSQGYERAIEESLETGQEVEYTLNWQTTEGQEIWSQIRIIPEYDAQGVISSVLAIGRDISELIATEQQLQSSQKQLRQLLLHQEAEYDAHRKSVAWEVYDSLGQLLMVQRMNIGLLQTNAINAPEARQKHLKKMLSIVDHAIGIVRTVSNTLRPSALNMGVPTALEWIVEESLKNTDISWKLRLEEDDIALDDISANLLFHIVQDALDMIVQDKNVTTTSIHLARKYQYYELHIRFNSQERCLENPAKRQLGLFHIQERIQAIGGETVLLCSENNGTLLEVRLPITDGAGQTIE